MSQDDAHQQLEDALLGPGDLASALDAIRRGADVRAPFFDGSGVGSAPLTWAVSKSLGPEGSVRCVQAMLAAGATVASEPWEQWGTSVHRAAEYGYVEALRLLLGADGKGALGRFDELSRTPLIRAVVGGSVAAAEMLIAAGADVNASDEPRIGNPPIRWATEEHNEEMVTLLLRAGADPTKPGWMQHSALDVARGWKASRKPELVHIFELLDLVARRPEARHSLKSPAPRRH
jgi:hypothetical protein